ncbi:MAG: hypothetical protein ACFFCS_18345 [Candidatus Hodarchaeota archaeon]
MSRKQPGKFKKFYKASRSRFFFIFVGIPLTAFMIIIFLSYFVFATIMMFLPITCIALAMLPKAIKTKKWYLYVLKIDVIFFFTYLGLVPNPTYWPSQIHRRLDHGLLITPDEPMVQSLNDTDKLWDYINDRYGQTPQQLFSEPVDVQVYRIYRYVRSLIDYTYDIDNNWVFDYAATPKEVLTKGQDDCQGISCTTVSLLVYLGYDAYVAEIPFHWYIRVYYDDSNGTRTFTDLYRSSDQPDPFYLFNETHAWYPEEFFTTINMSFGYDYVPEKYAEIVNGTLDLSVISDGLPETDIPPQVTWLLIYLSCVLIGFLMTIFLKIPRIRKGKWHKILVSTFTCSAFLFLGFYSIMFVPFSYFLYFALFIVCTGVFITDNGIVHAAIRRLILFLKGKFSRN